MRVLLVMFILLPVLSLGQTATFTTIDKKTNWKGSIRYPVVRYADKKAEKKINEEIAFQFFGNDVKNNSDLQAKLDEMAGFTYQLYYTVTYNKQHVLSFIIFTEVCGANCKTFSSYFNFDLATGDPIEWAQLTLPGRTDSLERMVKSRMRTEMNAFRKAVTDSLGKVDSIALQEVNESFEDCQRSAGIYGFAIYPDRIDFINRCDFTHSIKRYTPHDAFSYSAKELAPYLKPRYLALLLKK